MQKKSERLFRIFTRLKEVPQSVEELHLWCKSQNIPGGLRTIYRYIDELTEAVKENGFQVVSIGKGTRDLKWHVIPIQDNPSTARLGDAIKGFQIMSQLSGLHVKSIGLDYLQKLSDDVLHSLNSEDSGSIDLINHLVVTGWGQTRYDERDRKNLEVILKAIGEKRKVQLDFIAQLQTEDPLASERLWKPHVLVSHRGSIFIACNKEYESKLFFIDLESIISVKIKNVKFRNQLPKLAVESFLKDRFGITPGNGPVFKIKLAFHPSDPKTVSGFKNPFVQKRIWHPGQRFSIDTSGKYLVLEFDSQLTRELVGWIMMWMDHIKVLEPIELKSLILQKMDAMKEILDGADPLFSTPGRF
ncbi:MAG: helix-turn-helix transcriptional regulator [Bacteroidota bacterium]